MVTLGGPTIQLNRRPQNHVGRLTQKDPMSVTAAAAAPHQPHDVKTDAGTWSIDDPGKKSPRQVAASTVLSFSEQ